MDTLSCSARLSSLSSQREEGTSFFNDIRQINNSLKKAEEVFLDVLGRVPDPKLERVCESENWTIILQIGKELPKQTSVKQYKEVRKVENCFSKYFRLDMEQLQKTPDSRPIHYRLSVKKKK